MHQISSKFALNVKEILYENQLNFICENKNFVPILEINWLLTDSCSLASCDKASLVWLNSIVGLSSIADDNVEVSDDANELSVSWLLIPPTPILVLLLMLYSISVVSSSPNCCVKIDWK